MKTETTQSGFTLLELVVALSIFSMFMVIIIGLFSRFVEIEHRDIAQQSLQEDLYAALESFNREVRTGYGTTFATSDGRQVFFHNQNGDCVQYRFENSAIQRAQTTSATDSCRDVGTFTDSDFVPLTSTDTIINQNQSRFDPAPGIIGGEPGTNSQGFITIIIEATSRRANLVPLHLQSTITSTQVIPYVAS